MRACACVRASAHVCLYVCFSVLVFLAVVYLQCMWILVLIFICIFVCN